MVRIVSVTPLKNFRVRLGFSDDTEKEVDLEPFLRGEVFRPIKKDLAVFRSVKVDKELGTIVRDNGADIDPDVLHYGRRPAWKTRR